MALMDEMFKGNLATGMVVGLGAVLFAPTIFQTVGRVGAAGSQGGHQEQLGLLPRNPERDWGNGR
jgi:hypothetical protein